MAKVTVSRKNIYKPVPPVFVKIKRIVNVGLIPVAVTTIKGLWMGDDSQLNRILLLITVTLPGLLEVIGMALGEQDETPKA